MRDIVIVDTAGGSGSIAEMMQQAADIRDAVQPDEVLFVIDGRWSARTRVATRRGVS
jgi:signal recognition particle subunit SRP54